MATGFSSIGRSSVVGSDFIYDHTCTRCHSTNGSYSEAAYYCPQCDVYYCKPCMQHACDHGILGRAELRRWGQPRDTHDHPDCSAHPGNAIQLYCGDHETVGCYLCVVMDHKSCTNMSYIPRGRKEEEPRNKVNPIDQGCADTKSTVTEEVSTYYRREMKSKVTKETMAPSLANKVRVTGPGVEHGVLATFNSKFTIETERAGLGKLAVDAHSAGGAFGVHVTRGKTPDRNYYCRFDPIRCGQYTINVRWSGEHVPGSPFHVQICDTPEELNRFLTSDT